jgi:hypothetical protein
MDEYLSRHILDLPSTTVNDMLVTRDVQARRDENSGAEEINFKWNYTPMDFRDSAHTEGISPVWVRALKILSACHARNKGRNVGMFVKQ